MSTSPEPPLGVSGASPALVWRRRSLRPRQRPRRLRGPRRRPSAAPPRATLTATAGTPSGKVRRPAQRIDQPDPASSGSGHEATLLAQHVVRGSMSPQDLDDGTLGFDVHVGGEVQAHLRQSPMGAAESVTHDCRSGLGRRPCDLGVIHRPRAPARRDPGVLSGGLSLLFVKRPPARPLPCSPSQDGTFHHPHIPGPEHAIARSSVILSIAEQPSLDHDSFRVPCPPTHSIPRSICPREELRGVSDLAQLIRVLWCLIRDAWSPSPHPSPGVAPIGEGGTWRCRRCGPSDDGCSHGGDREAAQRRDLDLSASRGDGMRVSITTRPSRPPHADVLVERARPAAHEPVLASAALRPRPCSTR